MKIIIPMELIGSDVWVQDGKIEVRENISREDALRLQKIFPNVQIIEDIPIERPKRIKE